jgi:hypothetical protein
VGRRDGNWQRGQRRTAPPLIKRRFCVKPHLKEFREQGAKLALVPTPVGSASQLRGGRPILRRSWVGPAVAAGPLADLPQLEKMEVLTHLALSPSAARPAPSALSNQAEHAISRQRNEARRVQWRAEKQRDPIGGGPGSRDRSSVAHQPVATRQAPCPRCFLMAKCSPLRSSFARRQNRGREYFLWAARNLGQLPG